MNLLDHAVELISILTFVVGLIATWTKMTVKMNVLEKDILDNRATLSAEMKRLEESINGGLARCRTDHEPCRQATMNHHENMFLHRSPQEQELINQWRADVTVRLGAIEALLRDIKHNNGR